jgi:hypothetical protein
MSEDLRVSTLFTVAPGQKLLGEIITWELKLGGTVPYTDVLDALAIAGLDTCAAKQLIPRNAFARACKKMAEKRIIRAVIEDAAVIKFQFTSEVNVGDELAYVKEAILTLDKNTGDITCPLVSLADRARTELAQCMENRTTHDVTAILKRLFSANADLFPIKELGGVYFVPVQHRDFLAKVEVFLTRIRGYMNRFPIAAGLNEAIEGFGTSTRPDTLERAASRIREAKFKVESYAEYLGAEKDRLLGSVEQLTEKLRDKVVALSEAEEAKPEPVSV